MGVTVTVAVTVTVTNTTAQWVIDAVTCFIRDFELKDHTVKYARMKDVDQQAIREEGDAWALLTKGRAILQAKKLLPILWQADEFKSHSTELLDLLVRFGLVVPVPNKPDEYIIPALLREVASASAPRGWPAASADSATMRIHFSLAGQVASSGSSVVSSRQ